MSEEIRKMSGETNSQPAKLNDEEVAKATGGDSIPYFRAYCLYEGCGWECTGTREEISVKCNQHKIEKGPVHGRFKSEYSGQG